MLLKKAFSSGGPGLFASPGSSSPAAVPTSSSSSNGSSAVSAAPAPTSSSSWRDFDWLRRGTSAIARRTRSSVTPAPPMRSSANPSVPSGSPHARSRLTVPAGAAASSASATPPRHRSTALGATAMATPSSISTRSSLASQGSSNGVPLPTHTEPPQHQSLRPSEADDEDGASTHPSTLSTWDHEQTRAAPSALSSSNHSTHSSVHSSLNASRTAAYVGPGLDLPFPTPLAPRRGKQRHANASTPLGLDPLSATSSRDGSTNSSRPRGRRASTRAARSRAGRPTTVPAVDDTTPRGSLDFDASTPESRHTHLAASSSAHCHSTSQPTSNTDQHTTEVNRTGTPDAEHSGDLPTSPQKTNNVRTRARARGSVPLTSASATEKAAVSTSAATGDGRGVITHPLFARSQHSISPRSAVSFASSEFDEQNAISEVSKRLSRQLAQSEPGSVPTSASAAGDVTLKASALQQDDAVEKDVVEREEHTLSNQSSASTLALRPRTGALPLSTLQALAPTTAQTGSNFASRFKAAREQTHGLTPTPSRSGGPSLTEKSSVATLTSSSMLTSSSSDPLKPVPSTPKGSLNSPISSSMVADGRKLDTSKSQKSLSDDDGVRTMGIAVVGQRSVGKTSVIRRGLRQYGISRPTVLSNMIRAYAIRCVLDQSAAEKIRILELDSAAFVAPTGTELAWPTQLADSERPGHGKIDGAIICYDAGNLPSLKGVPELLEFFHKCHVHTVVLACKSDTPAKAIDPFLVRELASKFGARVTECSTAPSPAGTAGIGEENKRRLRDTFHHLLRLMAQERVQRADLELGYATATVRHRHHHGPNRATAASCSGGKDKGRSKDLPGKRSHTFPSLFSSSGARVNLEDLPLEERERMQEEEQAAGPGPEALSISDFLASIDLMTPSFSSSSSESEDENGVRIEPGPAVDGEGAESEGESHASTWSASSRRSSVVSATSSNPEIEQDEVDPSHMLRDVAIPSMPNQIGGASAPERSMPVDGRKQDTSSSVAISGAYDSHFPLASGRKKARAKEPVYVPLADLLERFFLSAVSTTDSEFISAVLVFFRAFTSPELLLSEFMAHFDALTGGGSQDAGNAKMGNQQGLTRLISTFHDWIRQYPGDLSPPATTATVSGFLDEIAHNPATSAMAQAIEHDVELCQSTIDLDVMWSVDASAALLLTPSAWAEVGASESAAARHDAYRHSVLLPTSQSTKQDPSTESAKRALEALSPSGLSMLSPSPDVPPELVRADKASPVVASVPELEPVAVRSTAPSPSVATMSDGHAPTAVLVGLAQTLKVSPSEAENRARSTSVQTASSGQASVYGWRQARAGAQEQSASPATGSSVGAIKADKPDGFLSEPRSSLRPTGPGGHPRSNTISSVSTTGQTSVSAASVSSGATSTVPSSLGSVPVGTEAPSAKHVMSLRAVSNALLVVDEGALAEEMTRLEWALFSVIGPRDWLRHALVKPRHRVPHGRVAQSIAHFNYTSAWVVSVILAQPKIKARVRIMEKLIRLAVRLRMLNNYNSLYAVLAGLASSPVHRLKNTRAVVQEDKELHKRYLSLHRLMRPDRASSAYRLALENSSGRIIPFIGVHLHDILSSAEGNPSRRQADGAVHWRKFALMDDAISTLTKAQRADSSPPVEHPNLTPLFMDVPILEEDAAYNMSLALEPKTTSSSAHNFLRKMQGS